MDIKTLKTGDLVKFRGTAGVVMTVIEIIQSEDTIRCRYYNQVTGLFEVQVFWTEELFTV